MADASRIVEWNDGVPYLDLRGLQPPQPAVAILRYLESGDCGGTLVVRLSRDPIFLYPELVERGWQWQPLSEAPGDVSLRIYR